MKKVNTLILVIGFYIFIESIGITCPIKFLFGISCPGCGMSRAYVSLLTGNIDLAFYYHPLFAIPIILVLFHFNGNKKLTKIACSFSVLAFIICYLIRLFDTSDSIVCFSYSDSLLYSLISGIKKWLIY